MIKRMLPATGVLMVSVAMAYAQTNGPISLLPLETKSASRSAVLNSAILDQYCSSCHNDALRSGGFALSELDLEQPGETAERMEEVILKLRSGMMPPPGIPRPKAAAIDAFVAELEESLDAVAVADPNPGRPILHRLNRTEYSNSIRDLLGLEIDAGNYLPPDDMSEGYDNMSDVLTVSPALLESYMSTAGKISRMAVGDPETAPVVETYVVPQAFSQMRHVPGTPFGTRGGTVVHHNFPADGEYTFWVSFYYASIGPLFGDNIPAEGEQIEISIDGERVALLDIPRKLKTVENVGTKPIKVSAGPHDVSAAFIERGAGPVEDFVMPFERVLVDLSTGHFPGLTGLPHLRNMGINGPYNVTGVSPIPSHARVFVCLPADDTEETSCAHRIVSRLARKAFRRPVTDQDVEQLMSYFRSGREQRDFDAGIRLALQAILADPEFLFRFERDPEGAQPGSNHSITDLELASRLSYFLWSSAPDDTLITFAADGQLSDPAILEQQVLRMLADPKAETLSTNFASHWLRLQNLKDIHPDAYLFPNWDYNLTQSMWRETELFFNSVVREDRSIIDLLDADYTFVDGRLARHYEVPNVIGNRFRRVIRRNGDRRGLLGQGSILTLTSMANRTSPVLRGAWIMEVILGAPPPNPPANVPPLEENETGQKLLSVRERLESHRENPACGACHNIMDPLGFALENYDAVGAWREKDSGFPIDPSGNLFDGTELTGPSALREYLLQKQDMFVTNFTRNLLMYAMGRVLHYYDMPAIRGIVRRAGAEDNRFSSFVMAIVNSTPFQMRRVGPLLTEEDAARQ